MAQTKIRSSTQLKIPTSTGTAVFSLDASDGSTISINNDATATPMGNSDNFAGILIIRDTATDGTIGAFVLGGSFSDLFGGNTTIYSNTKDTASKINVYQDSANSYITTIQNKTGVTRTLRIMCIRLGNAA